LSINRGNVVCIAGPDSKKQHTHTDAYSFGTDAMAQFDAKLSFQRQFRVDP
jgi:hypothetical protein